MKNTPLEIFFIIKKAKQTPGYGAALLYLAYVCFGLIQHKVAGGWWLFVSLPAPLLADLTAGTCGFNMHVILCYFCVVIWVLGWCSFSLLSSFMIVNVVKENCLDLQ